MSVRTPLYMLVATAMLAGLSQACGVIAGLYMTERPATIGYYHDSTAITSSPDPVTHGVPFQIHFQTFENGCTDSRPRESVVVSRDSILIRSFVTTDVSCHNDALLILAHTVSAQVDQPGPLRIYILGRQEANGIASDALVRRTVTVK